MLPTMKSSVLIHTNSASNATNVGYVDRRGFDFATIDVIGRTEAATDTVPALLTLYHGDTTTINTATTYLLITGGTDFTMRSLVATVASTGSFRSLQKINVDLRGRRRYLFVRYTPSTTAATEEVTVIANLMRAKEAPLASYQLGGIGLGEI